MIGEQPLAADPMVQGFEGVRRLPGFSIADVFLLSRERGPWFVRKASRHAAHNERLRRQAVKQAAFGRAIQPVVHTPPILGEGTIAGRYYFDMAFVRGRDGASFMRATSYRELIAFAERLRQYVLMSASTGPVAGVGGPVDLAGRLRGKVREIRDRLAGKHADLLEDLEIVVESLARVGPLECTICHGDLTLENILIDDDGGLWCFDLLESPVEHYWLDLSKFYQDLDGGWYLRRGPRIAQGVSSFVSRELRALANELDNRYAAVHDALLAVTFARILPYARLADDVALVRCRLIHFLNRADKSRGLPRSR